MPRVRLSMGHRGFMAVFIKIRPVTLDCLCIYTSHETKWVLLAPSLSRTSQLRTNGP